LYPNYPSILKHR
jgi:hypothetical protein